MSKSEMAHWLICARASCFGFGDANLFVDDSCLGDRD